MNTIEHLLTTLSEECMEAMEALYTGTENCNIAVELRDIIAVADLINQSGELGVALPLVINGHRVYFNDEVDTVEYHLHKVLLKIQYYVSKSLRFGLTDIKPGSDKSNEQELETLMMEYAYHIQTLTHKNPSIDYDAIYDQNGIAEKQEKVLINMAFAIKQGTLQLANNEQTQSQTDIEKNIDLIKELCQKEASLINALFGQNEDLGLNGLESSLYSFERFLKKNNPMFIRAMSIEYRTFIVELIKLIDKEYQAVAMSKILMS